MILGGEVKKMPIFKRARMSGVKMIANLPGADLSGADLSHAMVGVDIKNQGMGQMRTDLSNANLAGAILVGRLQSRADELLRPQGQRSARHQLLPDQAGRGRPRRPTWRVRTSPRPIWTARSSVA